MSNIITTRNILRAFPVGGDEEFYALKGVSVEIPQNALTIIKGRSGSGKTTLLNIISALDTPTGGAVFFDNEEISAFSDDKRDWIRRKQFGFVFQSVALIPIMTAYENVEFGLRLAGYEGDRRARTVECLTNVGLSERMDHMPYEMSGGEQQRVAIARAIAHHPKVIFADEPTGALDTNTGLKVMQLFKDLLEKEDISIVMTTHDPGLMQLGDKVYEISDGEIEGGSVNV